MRKGSCFGWKYLCWLPQTWQERSRGHMFLSPIIQREMSKLFIIMFFIFLSTQTRLIMSLILVGNWPKIFPKNILLFRTQKCLNAVSNSGHWLGSLLVYNSTSIPSTSGYWQPANEYVMWYSPTTRTNVDISVVCRNVTANISSWCLTLR